MNKVFNFGALNRYGLEGTSGKELERSAKEQRVRRPVCENFNQVAKASRIKQTNRAEGVGF